MGVVKLPAETGERGQRRQHLRLAAVLEAGLPDGRAGRLAGRPVRGAAGRQQGERHRVLGVAQHRAEADAGGLFQALHPVPAVAGGALHAAEDRAERQHRGTEQPQPPPAVLPAVVAVSATARAEEVTENVSPPPRADTPQPCHGATPQTWQAACTTMGRSRDRTPRPSHRPGFPVRRCCHGYRHVSVPRTARDPRKCGAGHSACALPARGRRKGGRAARRTARQLPLVRTTRAARG